MLFKLLVILHTLGATVWVGGHLILALTLLPKALRQQDATPIQQFEQPFERLGLGALLLQVLTGIALTLIYFPGGVGFWPPQSVVSQYVLVKLGLLLATLALAVQARWFILPKLTAETLPRLGFHIMGVTVLAVLLTIFGVGIRLGGLV
ncbi:CopD family protein [Thermosynechococcus sp. TG252]|uniref:CopD family protein n=1 Tax=Thermosynechococcus sp. TG252 TaxID=3074097 RepID=UPI00286602DC|nr:CopD family protein [Thermosynechococcus sp. TG252]MDR7992489.1 CopD family protein [Thermosynechococcus sp. TG252]